VVQKHDPECEFAAITQAHTVKTFGGEFRMIQLLLNSVVQATMTINYGAGGYSVAPHLICFRIVNVHESPAFQAVNMFSQLKLETADEQEEAARLLKQKLSSLYATGRSSPMDVVYGGNNTLLSALFAYSVSFYHIYPDFHLHNLGSAHLI
jgi:hypothetical protein